MYNRTANALFLFDNRPSKMPQSQLKLILEANLPISNYRLIRSGGSWAGHVFLRFVKFYVTLIVIKFQF